MRIVRGGVPAGSVGAGVTVIVCSRVSNGMHCPL